LEDWLRKNPDKLEKPLNELRRAIAFLRAKEIIHFDAHFRNILTDNAIDVLTSNGKLSHLVKDNRLIWSNSLSFGEPSWLYVAVNQLNRSLLLNPQTDEGRPSIMHPHIGLTSPDEVLFLEHAGSDSINPIKFIWHLFPTL
jgi:hypothetical protein